MRFIVQRWSTMEVEADSGAEAREIAGAMPEREWDSSMTAVKYDEAGC